MDILGILLAAATKGLRGKEAAVNIYDKRDRAESEMIDEMKIIRDITKGQRRCQRQGADKNLGRIKKRVGQSVEREKIEEECRSMRGKQRQSDQ
jgi:hypothetical protein